VTRDGPAILTTYGKKEERIEWLKATILSFLLSFFFLLSYQEERKKKGWLLSVILSFLLAFFFLTPHTQQSIKGRPVTFY
jgi:hypothetical protein